ncbi:MAG: OmpA family protein, partial [Myxococcota bacterium]
LRDGIRVAVSDEVLFASGSADLDPLGQEVIEKVSRQLASLDHVIEVQGHTDDRAISDRLSDRFPSNWDLAGARAAAVVRQMELDGVHGDRLSLTSFASHRPVAANDSPVGRAQNRRIEIRLRPRSGKTVGEKDAAPQAKLPRP